MAGVSWVTFDSTSGSSGSPTPRIFVGVASAGEDNIFVSEDAGASCTLLFYVVTFSRADHFPRRGRGRWAEQHVHTPQGRPVPV